ncbi:MAG TPA: replication-associated recombination protein A [bacterium]|nr:replication-associated recombination protein A [bacterium]
MDQAAGQRAGPRSRSDPPAGQQAMFSDPPAAAEQDVPLAARMRPRSLEEFVGQEHLVGPGRALRRAIEEDRLVSMILWGPPGSGKTTLAQVIGRQTRAHVVALSGVTAGVADLRRAAQEARERRRAGQRTILFVDEIHRFNKSQQDAVLPAVESGLLTLIGATTENPSFEVNSALLSRARVFRLEPLTREQVAAIIERALADPARGLGAFHVKLDPDARELLLDLAGGDARVALNALELAAAGAAPAPAGARHVTRAAVADAFQRRALRYDRAGDQHYDLISALIKSVRGSDPDAAIYWLARILEAGEDPLFVARRLVILASEDVGLADPHALPLAVAAQQAVHFVGMPEAHFALAEATLYLASAPKSHSAKTAYQAAADEVMRSGDLEVPLHLRNAPTPLMHAMGYGKGYRDAHDFPGHVVEQQYLPDALAGRRFYVPSDQGAEAEIRARREHGADPEAQAEETANDYS